MNLNAVLAWPFPPTVQEFSVRDTILYALGVGAGADPLNRAELRFVYEADLQAIPTFACALANPDPWMKDPAVGINYSQALHGEEHISWSRPMVASGMVRSECRVVGVRDKGVGKGALVYFEKHLFECTTNLSLCTIRRTLFLRGDGGCGDGGEAPTRASLLPDRLVDRMVDLPTLPRQALIYRLSGDYNPLHVDPDIAINVGFPGPILHGLCIAGIACRGLLNTYCRGDSHRLASLRVRFSRPMYPGETLRLECFEIGSSIRFRARALERDVVVLDCCEAALI